MNLFNKCVKSFLLLLLTACADTDMTGVLDPSYKNNFVAKRIIIKGANIPLTDEVKLINSLKKSANEYDVEIINGMSVFPSTRDYSSEELMKIAQKYSADSILWFAMHQDSSSVYIPGDHSYSHISTYGNSSRVTTFFDEGYYSERNRVCIKFILIDTKNGKTIWIADGNSKGQYDFADLINNLSEKALSMLSEKRILRKKH